MEKTLVDLSDLQKKNLQEKKRRLQEKKRKWKQQNKERLNRINLQPQSNVSKSPIDKPNTTDVPSRQNNGNTKATRDRMPGIRHNIRQKSLLFSQDYTPTLQEISKRIQNSRKLSNERLESIRKIHQDRQMLQAQRLAILKNISQNARTQHESLNKSKAASQNIMPSSNSNIFKQPQQQSQSMKVKNNSSESKNSVSDLNSSQSQNESLAVNPPGSGSQKASIFESMSRKSNIFDIGKKINQQKSQQSQPSSSSSDKSSSNSIFGNSLFSQSQQNNNSNSNNNNQAVGNKISLFSLLNKSDNSPNNPNSSINNQDSTAITTSNIFETAKKAQNQAHPAPAQVINNSNNLFTSNQPQSHPQSKNLQTIQEQDKTNQSALASQESVAATKSTPTTTAAEKSTTQQQQTINLFSSNATASLTGGLFSSATTPQLDPTPNNSSLREEHTVTQGESNVTKTAQEKPQVSNNLFSTGDSIFSTTLSSNNLFNNKDNNNSTAKAAANTSNIFGQTTKPASSSQPSPQPKDNSFFAKSTTTDSSQPVTNLFMKSQDPSSQQSLFSDSQLKSTQNIFSNSKLNPNNNIFANLINKSSKPSGSSLFDPKNQQQESEGEQEDQNGNAIVKEVINPKFKNTDISTQGNFEYEKPKILFKESALKFKKIIASGDCPVVENVTVSIEKQPKNQTVSIIVRLQNCTVRFFGILLPNVTKASLISGSSSSVKVQFVVESVQGKNSVNRVNMKIMFKQAENASKFVEEVSKLSNK